MTDFFWEQLLFKAPNFKEELSHHSSKQVSPLSQHFLFILLISDSTFNVKFLYYFYFNIGEYIVVLHSVLVYIFQLCFFSDTSCVCYDEAVILGLPNPPSSVDSAEHHELLLLCSIIPVDGAQPYNLGAPLTVLEVTLAPGAHITPFFFVFFLFFISCLWHVNILPHWLQTWNSTSALLHCSLL